MLYPIHSIVVIDDNPISNILATKLVEYEKVSHKITAFQNAEAAFEYLKDIVLFDPEKFPALIFLDVNMPQMNGWDFLALYQNLPQENIDKCYLFMLSSSVSDSDMEKVKQFPCVTDYLVKPINKDMLQNIIGQYFTQTFSS